MIHVTRKDVSGTGHIVRVRAQELTTDMAIASGGEDAGPDPHDLYKSAPAARKALTILWYAQRKDIPLEDIEVAMARDGSGERNGMYRLSAAISLSGTLTEEHCANCCRSQPNVPCTG